MNEPSIWSFITNADIVVKCVMFILFAASITSWTIIFQRHHLFKNITLIAKQFQAAFWNSRNLSELKQSITNRNVGLPSIFCAGIEEFGRLHQPAGPQTSDVLGGVDRAMRVAEAREIDRLEIHLNILATIGSTSPYIGLFGTVWGIMSAFRALGAAQQLTIAMVAPGISEALVTTAIGLFAAIPAVIAYNRLTNQLSRLQNHYVSFQDELLGVLQRQL